MKGPLYLSRNTDNSSSIIVSPQITQRLLPHEIDGVRFLYQQCIIKKHNVILNSDINMNDARQISALLSAINKYFPTLIICQNSSIAKWHYEFSKVNLKIVTPNELIKDDDESDLPDAVIVSHEQIKHIKVLPVTEWFFYIIEDIDLVIKSRFIKNIKSQFRIALTTRNFVVNEDDNLQWDILKWTNPLIEDKNTFIENNNFNKKNLLYPFPEYWRRISWILYDKPTNVEIKEYDEIINNWFKSVSNKKTTCQSRKRKFNQSTKNNKTRTKNISPISKKFEKLSVTKNNTKLEMSEKLSGSETEEEPDLLNSFVSVKTKEKCIKSDLNEDED